MNWRGMKLRLSGRGAFLDLKTRVSELECPVHGASPRLNAYAADSGVAFVSVCCHAAADVVDGEIGATSWEWMASRQARPATPR